jgi:hypothetical protein
MSPCSPAFEEEATRVSRRLVGGIRNERRDEK